MLMADGGDEGKDRQRRGEVHHTCKCINYAEQSKLSVLVSATKGQCTTMDFNKRREFLFPCHILVVYFS